jgi:hypothetical protein
VMVAVAKELWHLAAVEPRPCRQSLAVAGTTSYRSGSTAAFVTVIVFRAQEVPVAMTSSPKGWTAEGYPHRLQAVMGAAAGRSVSAAMVATETLLIPTGPVTAAAMATTTTRPAVRLAALRSTGPAVALAAIVRQQKLQSE